MSQEIMRDTDLMLGVSKNTGASVVLTNKDLGGSAGIIGNASSKHVSLKRKNVILEKSDTKRKSCVSARTNETPASPSSNNILLLARSDEPLNDPVKNSIILNTVSKSVFLCQNQHNFNNRKGQQLKSSSPLAVQGPVIVERSNSLVDCDQETAEPMNLSMKARDILSSTATSSLKQEKKNIISPRQTFSSRKSPNSFMTQTEKMLSHSVSITPIVRIDDNDDKDPLDLEDGATRQDIDDDEDTYLQNISRDIVEVKLESKEEDERVAFSCTKCNRSYAEKRLCELHMRTVHYASKKEKCDICGVRFINLKAHKEKYHFFVDVDKCNLCGKVDRVAVVIDGSHLFSFQSFFTFLILSFQVVKYLSSHHCPLQQKIKSSREIKLDCPKCGNLVKQKYLKIHQKNHCVGFKSSTFSNFRTAANLQVDTEIKYTRVLRFYVGKYFRILMRMREFHST